MARGWESKSVESQIEERQRESDAELRLPPVELDRKKEREGLELSRRRIERELAAATSDIRRTSLQQAMKHLDEQLRKLTDLETK